MRSNRRAVPDELVEQWEAAWPDAMQMWSPFVTLRHPVFCRTADEASAERATGVLAMIRLVDQSVMVNLPEIQDQGLGPFPVEILAHEIGHHVVAPANLTVNARLLAGIRHNLPGCEMDAPIVANLWTDLLINDRLHRDRGLDMAAPLKALAERDDSEATSLWTMYLRTYEILWSLVRGTLARGEVTDAIEADAMLASRVVRVFGREVERGGASFALLCLPHLLRSHDEGDDAIGGLAVLADTREAGADGVPDGLTEVDLGSVVHPVHDPAITGVDVVAASVGDDDATEAADGLVSGGSQFREPFEYGEILRATGLVISDEDAAIRYYRERAIPHLVPFPVETARVSTEPLPEGVEVWDVGEPLQGIDWIETTLRSPVPIPGVTTMQRVWGTTEGSLDDEQPVNLDLYIDSSGSMPNPRLNISYLALAGAIISLSALRAGASVQATLWSGARQFVVTDGFVRDETQILAVVTGYLGGATAFPLHVMRDTYRDRPASARPTHILVISDDGVDTMYNDDERGNDGRTISQQSLEAAGAGGTMVLNLFRPVDDVPSLQPAIADGWDVHRIQGWDDLVGFARAFSRRTFPMAGLR